MANKQRGHVSMTVGDETYTLAFTMNAMCELEDVFGQPFQQIADTLGGGAMPKIGDLRKLLWGALTEFNDGFDECDPPTLRRVGVLANDFGLVATMEKIGEAFEAAFPPADQAEK